MTVRILTQDVVRAEALAAYVGHDWRGTEGLCAGWSVMFGPVTRVLFLQAMPEGTAADGRTHPALPVPPDPAMVEARERLWLKEHRPARRVDGAALFELRAYDARPGQGAAFLARMLGAMPVRERHSPNCGVWQCLSGSTERVLHLWGYRDLAERDAVRAALKQDAEWQAYTAIILPMLRTLETTLLTPLPRC